MKNFLVVFITILFFIPWKASSQLFFLDNGFNNNGKVTGCTGTFKDSNPFGNYNTNEQYVVTFFPASSPNQAIQLVFDTLEIAFGDTLFVYDGTDINAPLLTDLTNRDGAPLSLRATAINTTGALTFKFISRSPVSTKGWSARLSCKSACQPITVKLNSVPAADENGFINICKGQEVLFSGAGIYPQNDKFYRQDDVTSKFLWTFSEGGDTSGIFAHQVKRKFDKEGGIVVQLTLVDQNECYNLVPAQLKIRSSLTPVFDIPQPAICLNDTLALQPSPSFPKGNFSNLPVNSDSKPLPDGKGVCYQTSINVNNFLPGQVLSSINDLEGILLNIEHSWLGDITIAITAPNNAKVFLKKTVGTANDWGAYLGEPADEPAVNSTIYDSISKIVGKGYDYLFSPKAIYGTMEAEKKNHLYTYLDNAGNYQMNHPYLPAGSYASEESLSALVGTPLNGIWTLEVCDLFKEDNGYIFYWTIKMKSSTYPNPEEFSRTVSSHKWENAVGLVSTTDALAMISPKQAGDFTYKYTITDNYGCSFDTSLTVRVNPLPASSGLAGNAVLCNSQALELVVTNALAGYTYNWSTGANDVSRISVSNPGKYYLVTTNTEGCRTADTITVVNTEFAGITFGSDTLFCATNPLILEPIIQGNIASFLWNTGATTKSLKLTTAGKYTVTGTAADGCPVTASVNVTDNPVNNLSLPADTSICFGTNYRLTLSTSPGTSLLWNNGSTANSQVITGEMYSVSADYMGCIKNDEMQVGIRPLPVVYLGADTVICEGFDLKLSASSPGASYLWSTGSSQSSIVASKPGTYWLQTNLNNCTYRDTIIMGQKPCDCNLKMPNAFSPNGDGINDLYRPEIDCFPKDFSFSVFNRYGQQVFITKDYNLKWSGAVNGNPLPIGTYYYILSFYNITLQQKELRKGSITLLR